jgi:thioredoxin-related protein
MIGKMGVKFSFCVAVGLLTGITDELMNFPRSLLLLLVAALLITPTFANGWGDNYRGALAAASKENKKVLLDFTGSDWCPSCIAIKKEIFDKPAFKEFADKNLVLVEIDIPQGKTLSPEVMKQNAALQEQYQVQGFPTLVLLDPQGKVIKQQIGFIHGGPKGFIDWANSGK